MLKWRLVQAVMAPLVAAPFGLVVLFHAPRWLRNVVAYPLDVGITADGEEFRGPWRSDTAGIAPVRSRFVRDVDLHPIFPN